MAENEGISVREFNRVQSESIHRKGRIKDLMAKLADAESRLAEAGTAIKAHEATIGALTGERDGLQAKLTAAPSELQQELDRLKGEIRTRDHRDKFNSLAKDQIRPEALDAAWKLAGWKADADEINEAEMGKSIGTLVETNPFLKADPAGSQAGAGGAKTVTQPMPAGPGTTRGGATPTGPAPSEGQSSYRMA